MSRTILIIAIAAIFGISPIAAQTKAILKTGTMQTKGIPEIDDLAIPVLAASYTVKETVVVVYFTRMPLTIPATAKKSPGSPFFLETKDDPTIAWLKKPDYLLIAVFRSTIPERDSFLKAFAERFEHFYTYAPDDPDISFPAVLDLK